MNLGENWVSLDPTRTTQTSLDQIDEVDQSGYPGLYREVQTYLDERIEEVLTGGKEADRGARSSARTCPPCAPSRTRS